MKKETHKAFTRVRDTCERGEGEMMNTQVNAHDEREVT